MSASLTTGKIEHGRIAGVAEIRELYGRLAARKIILLMFLFALLIAVALVATATGAAGIGVFDVCCVIASKIIPGLHLPPVSDLAETVVMELRLPRILLAALTGLSLAGAGTVMQGILRNPLVDPYTLGLSSGAAFGAALAIVLGTGVLGASFNIMGRYLIVTNAFIFGSLTMVLVYGIARLKGAIPETLLLAGVAFGYLFSAGVSALKYVSENEALKELVVWLMGGLWGASWDTVLILLPVVLICLGLLVRYAWDLNALGAGEDIAISLGVNVGRLRLATLALATLISSATIAFTGIIGFIGLIAPHICRILIGGDNRFLIPCACLMGGVLLLLADTLARVVLAPVEIPVGIVTSLIGTPFFIYLLLKRKRQWW
ncbi:MAG: iron complex transport system permease protein [Clostridia bacterium]|nr:iron complex transport system permease protein [Clostridia bacterium]